MPIISKRAHSNNRLVTSPHYGRILREYNDRLARDGAVVANKFYAEVVAPLLPEYKIGAWYLFLKRFLGPSGLSPANTVGLLPPADPLVEQEKIGRTLLSNQVATANLVQNLLNISASRAQDIIDHPELLTHKEAVELGLKVMKAQDSRIHAIGKLREDNREQEKFDRAFSDASSG